MKFDIHPEHFDTFPQLLIWRLGLDLAAARAPQELRPGEAELRRFFEHLFGELYLHPADFLIPEFGYEAFSEDDYSPEQEGSYRLRYNRKNDQVVYWCRLREPFNPAVRQNLRWKLSSEVTPNLFASLDTCAPGLSERVYQEIKRCAHCYGANCLARGWITRGGETVEVCTESAWDQIQAAPAGFADLRTVLQALQPLV